MGSKDLPEMKLPPDMIEGAWGETLADNGFKLYYGDPDEEHADHARGCEHLKVENSKKEDCRLLTTGGQVVYKIKI